VIENCIVRNNHGRAVIDNAYGGGISAWSSAPVITNCLISNNTIEGIPYPGYTSGYGGGIFLDNYGCTEEPVLTNCTVVGNRAIEGDYGGVDVSCEPVITNCIFWDNYPGSYSGSRNATTFTDMPDNITIFGNISTDPLFVSSGTSEYLLSHTAAGQELTSACVNSGSSFAAEICFMNDAICMDTLTTRTDNARDDAVVDMGFHYSTPATIPTPTPTPKDGVSVVLEIPDKPLVSGDPFYAKAVITNFNTEPLIDLTLFCILEIADIYWFYPSWSMEPDFMIINELQSGNTYFNIIPQFAWHSSGTTGSANFYTALVNADITTLIGDYYFVSISWL